MTLCSKCKKEYSSLEDVCSGEWCKNCHIISSLNFEKCIEDEKKVIQKAYDEDASRHVAIAKLKGN